METTRAVTEILADKPPHEQLIAEFISAFLAKNPNGTLNNPANSFKRVLRGAKLIGHDYYLSGNDFLFEIIDGGIVSVKPVPALTVHAKLRLHERHRVNPETALVQAALDIARGKWVSHKNKRKLRISQDVRAVQYENRVYLIKDPFTVLTVLDANNPKIYGR